MISVPGLLFRSSVEPEPHSACPGLCPAQRFLQVSGSKSLLVSTLESPLVNLTRGNLWISFYQWCWLGKINFQWQPITKPLEDGSHLTWARFCRAATDAFGKASTPAARLLAPWPGLAVPSQGFQPQTLIVVLSIVILPPLLLADLWLSPGI